MADEFKVHRLNGDGMEIAGAIGDVFRDVLAKLDTIIPQGRERSLVVTKLQEANFWAKRAIAIVPGNQE